MASIGRAFSLLSRDPRFIAATAGPQYGLLAERNAMDRREQEIRRTREIAALRQAEAERQQKANQVRQLQTIFGSPNPTQMLPGAQRPDLTPPPSDLLSVSQALLRSGNPDLIDKGLELLPKAQGQPPPEAPSSVREWEYYSQLGSPEQQRYLEMKRGGNLYDVGNVPYYRQPGGLTSQLAAPEEVSGYMAGQEREKVLARGAAEAELEAPKAEERAVKTLGDIDRVMNAVAEAEEGVSFMTTGALGALTGKFAGTPAYDLRKKIVEIKANIGFTELQKMREASPTGGALGQVAVQELEALQATLGSLDANQSEMQLRRNLNKVYEHYSRWRELVEASRMMNRQPVTGIRILGVE